MPASEYQPSARMTVDEKNLVRRLHFEQGKTRTEIAKLLKRTLSSVSRLLAQKKAPRSVGRPAALSEAKIDTAVTLLEKMVDEADGDYEVTLAMLRRRGRFKVGERTLANAIRARGFSFKGMRQKPILTQADIAERYAFAKKHRTKTADWWLRNIHIHIDNHAFKVATTPRGRKLLAKRTARGVYRRKGKCLRPGHVKPNSKLRLGLGCKGILKAGGVGDGKVLVWHTVEGKWSGPAAAEFYKEVVKPAVSRHYGRKRKYCILEDNDPTGNLSNVGRLAKAAMKLDVFVLPKRSPELNVMDYAVWSEVERRLRAQERRMPGGKHETRAQFGRRLDRIARTLPKDFIERSIGDMARRCQLLYEAKGGLFEEGGRRRRPL